MSAKASDSLEDPILSWGDPVGTYKLHVVAGGGVLTYHARQPNGGHLAVSIPMTNEAIAEMRSLLDMLVFDAEVMARVRTPAGRIATVGNA